MKNECTEKQLYSVQYWYTVLYEYSISGVKTAQCFLPLL